MLALFRKAEGVRAVPLEQPKSPDIDVFRAISALLVLASHCSIIGLSWGAVGVFSFFTLSGYLLYGSMRPIAAQAQNKERIKGIVGYFVRRIFRIVPAYYVILIVYAFTPSHAGGIGVQDFLFIDAKGHFWTIKEELILYALLPFAAFSMIMCREQWRWLVACTIAAVTFYMTELNFYWIRTAPDYAFHLYAFPFVLGVISSEFFQGVPRKAARILFWVSVIVLVFLNVDGEWMQTVRMNVIGIGDPLIGWGHSWLVQPFCCTLLIGVAHADLPFFRNSSLRFVGVVGYSFYLYHFLAIEIAQGLFYTAWAVFCLAFIMSLAFATVSYLGVERPFIILGKSMTIFTMNRKNPPHVNASRHSLGNDPSTKPGL